jgi:hypothetical protein
MNNPEMDALPQRWRLKADIDWAPLYKAWENIPYQHLYQSIADSLLVAGSTPAPAGWQQRQAGNREESIRNSVITLLSTPEFQIC